MDLGYSIALDRIYIAYLLGFQKSLAVFLMFVTVRISLMHLHMPGRCAPYH